VAIAIGSAAKDSLPEEVYAWRRQLLDAATEHGVGTPLQAVETMIRQELRSRRFGIKFQVVSRLFETYPLDGILHWATQAYRCARDRPAWLIGMLERTGGNYHGRAASGAA
jgi:hypothetical protein